MNAQGRFALTAFSPLLFNIALIAVAAVLLGWRQDAGAAALILAATVGIAGLLQLSILVLRGGNIAKPLRISFDKEMRGFLGRAIPGMIASSAPQWLMVAGAVIASTSPSAVSWLYFANRLLELPLGIVGVAMGTVLIPEMTRAVQGEDRAAIAHAESRGLELAVGLALPAMLGLILLSGPIVKILFEHGAFTASDSAATAQALVWLALGLPAHVLVKALSPAFYAREDTIAPLLATLKAIAVAIVSGRPARPLVRRPRHRRRHRARRLEQRLLPGPRRSCDLRLFDRCRCIPPAAAHPCKRARDGRPAPACDRLRANRRHAHGRASDRAPDPDCRRNRGLWPVPRAAWRHLLARGG